MSAFYYKSAKKFDHGVGEETKIVIILKIEIFGDYLSITVHYFKWIDYSITVKKFTGQDQT